VQYIQYYRRSCCPKIFLDGNFGATQLPSNRPAARMPRPPIFRRKTEKCYSLPPAHRKNNARKKRSGSDIHSTTVCTPTTNKHNNIRTSKRGGSKPTSTNTATQPLGASSERLLQRRDTRGKKSCWLERRTAIYRPTNLDYPKRRRRRCVARRAAS